MYRVHSSLDRVSLMKHRDVEQGSEPLDTRIMIIREYRGVPRLSADPFHHACISGYSSASGGGTRARRRAGSVDGRVRREGIFLFRSFTIRHNGRRAQGTTNKTFPGFVDGTSC